MGSAGAAQRGRVSGDKDRGKRAQKSINPVAASDVGVRSAMGPPASRVGTMTSVLVPLHGIASRQDLPLPFTFVVVGAVLALIISFVVLVFAWRTPRFSTLSGVPLLPRLTSVVDHPAVRWIARLLVLAAFAIAAAAVMAGQDRLTNPSFGFVFVWMWVGLVPISLLLGWFWRATNPPDCSRRSLRGRAHQH